MANDRMNVHFQQNWVDDLAHGRAEVGAAPDTRGRGSPTLTETGQRGAVPDGSRHARAERGRTSVGDGPWRDRTSDLGIKSPG